MDPSQMMNTIIMGSMMKGTDSSIYSSILILLLVSVVNYLVNNYKQIYEKCNNWCFKFTSIKIVATRNDKGEEQNTKENNNLLIDAILVGSKNGKLYKLSNKNKLDSKHLDAYNHEKDRVLEIRNDGKYYDDDMMITYTEETTYIDIENNDKKNKNKKSESILTRQLILKSKKSHEHITKYINKKRDEYIENMFVDNNKRHVYNIRAYNEWSNSYCPYEFNSSASFDSLFIPDKQKIYDIVMNFKNKTGMYARQNIKHKLGVILHGKPGTGKTSFIKALANELSRNIIPIKLEKMKSIEAFSQLFNSVYLWNTQTESNDFVPMNKRLYVFEEIDTAGPIVMSRQLFMDTMKKNKKKFMNRFKNFVKTKDKQKDKNKDDTDTDSDDDELNLTNAMDMPINIGDILTIFDGICEYDGMVYVMTTNRKEILEPALYRPGRVTLDIELNEMHMPEIEEMLISYYGNHKRINGLAKSMDNLFVPAQLEIDCQQLTFEEFCAKYTIITIVSNSTDEEH
jgi:hypothetical protein